MKRLSATAFFCSCIFASGILLSGCAVPVKSDYRKGTNFAQYRTFALMPLPQKGPDEDPGLMLRISQPARETMVGELGAKGLHEVLMAEAQLAINLKGTSMPRVEVRDYGFHYPALTRYGTVMVVENPDVDVSVTTERTLTIEMFDNANKDLVWVGWITKESSSPATAQRVQKAIREVLAKYPPNG